MNVDPLENIGIVRACRSHSFLFLFWALAIKRMKGHFAASAALAGRPDRHFVYQMPVDLAVLATLYGGAFGLFRCAGSSSRRLHLQHVGQDRGQFEVIKNSLASIDDRRLRWHC